MINCYKLSELSDGDKLMIKIFTSICELLILAVMCPQIVIVDILKNTSCDNDLNSIGSTVFVMLSMIFLPIFNGGSSSKYPYLFDRFRVGWLSMCSCLAIGISTYISLELRCDYYVNSYYFNGTLITCWFITLLFLCGCIHTLIIYHRHRNSMIVRL